MPPPTSRLPLIDALKGVACLMIVWHHLAFYGPMSDIAHPLAPGLIDWLYEHGRMAVQVFLVVGGFLAASSLAPTGMPQFDHPGRHILRRYRRLVLPYLVALAFCVLVSALVRSWLNHPSVPDAPTLSQLLSHVLLLQDLLGQEALSAGVWYVAMDFQLFALTVALFSAVRAVERRWPGHAAQLPSVGLVLGLAALSLLVFNRHPALDVTALYFMASYGLGLLAFWAARSSRPGPSLAGIAVLGALALALDFRERIAVALATALLLGWAHSSEAVRRWQPSAWLLKLGQMSYSIFLIHFPVCLLVNAVVSHLWPTQPLVNAAGMALAFGLSLRAGRLLYQGVEARLAALRPARRLAG